MTLTPADLSWPAVTQRLAIRPAAVSDLERIFGYYRSPEVAEWLGSRPTDLEEFVERVSEPGLLGRIFVVEHAGIHVGDVYLGITDPWAQKEVRDDARGTAADIGYVIAPEFAGRGFASEAAAELLRICFEDLGLRRVTAECLADNAASWRVMEKLGMRREAVTRKASLHRTRGWLDAYGYALLADEWAASPAPGAAAAGRLGSR